MSTVYTKITEHTRFKNGIDQGVGTCGVGYDGSNIVLRYKFMSPPEGGSKISFEKTSWEPKSIDSDQRIMFFISPDENSHNNAYYTAGLSDNPQYDDYITLSAKQSDGYYTATGSVEKVLLPNRPYYLFFFPAFHNWGWYNVFKSDSITLTIEGAAGLVRIDIGTGIIDTVPYIDNGAEFKQVIPNIDDSTKWNICG